MKEFGNRYFENVAYVNFDNNSRMAAVFKENSTGEIDFMLQEASVCIPLEVKAEENLKARSLRAFCEKYHPSTALRSSISNYREQEWMTNVPLYMLISYLNRCKEEYPT